MDELQFYTYKNGEKVEICKKCMTMHIDNDNPETYMWLLKKMDVPYIKSEWDSLLYKAKEKAGPYKALTGMSVFGKYLSKMKLKQWNQYTWEDTERLQAEKEMKSAAAASQAPPTQSKEVLQEMYNNGEISEAEFLTLTEEPELTSPPQDQYYPENNPYPIVNLPNPADNLTEEDMVYLVNKWGRLHKPEQLLFLETLYNNMMDSFDIQSASREDALKKLCKTSLKMEEAIDCGDVDTYQKYSRVYDLLSKSGRFSEAQNKDQAPSFLGSVSELVEYCEKEGGFIPRFVTDVPQDIVDRTIQDMNRYTYNLVTKEMGLGQQIEDAIKKIQIQREMEDSEDVATDLEDAEQEVLNDLDFEEFYDAIQEDRDADAALTEGGDQDES
jgi:hypothetical protein